MKSPVVADWLLRRMVPSYLHADILGDLHEEFRKLEIEKPGRLRTRIWYWRQVLMSPFHYRIARPKNSRSRIRHQRCEGRLRLVPLWESVLADLRYAWRSLRRSPGFTLVAILSLGLGIGANTAVFSIYNALVLRTLPVERPDELVQVLYGDDRDAFTNPLWEEFRDRQNALSGAFAFAGHYFNRASGGEVRDAPGYWVSGDFFRVLGVRPAAGRLLTVDDDYRGCPNVAVVSFGYWQREFGGAGNAVGTAMMLDGEQFELVGVVDAGFSGVAVGSASDIYTPICTMPYEGMLDHRSAWFLKVLGRRERDATLERTAAHLARISEGVFAATVPPAWDTEGQGRYRAYTFSVAPAPNGVSRLRERYGSAVRVLMVIVGLVLLVACGNMANLMMARATRREREVAIRRAIGSGRGRLVRQFVTESLLLSVLSAIVAVIFARWASAVLLAMISPGGNQWLDLSVDLPLLGFALAVATLTSILFGLAPAWHASGVVPQAAMRTAGMGGTTRKRRFATRKALVIGQLALSLNLVVGAGLLLGTLAHLLTLDTGFNRSGVLVASVDLGNAGYSPNEYDIVQDELLRRMRAMPGVRSASAAQITPFSGSSANNHVQIDGYTPAARDETIVWYNFASDGFFATLETPLLAGRDFDSRDARGAPLVSVINETMANRFFGESQPLGRHFGMKAGSGETRWFEVIGVVADTKHETIEEVARPKAIFPLGQQPSDRPSLRYQIRTDGALTSLMPAVTELIAGQHPSISVRFSTLEDQVEASFTRPRLLVVLSGFFGAIALLLAMIGLYGTLAYQVTNRRCEIGLRLALGAARSRLLVMVLGEVGRMVLIGLAVGVALTFATTRFLASLLFGVTAMDPKTLAGSAVVLVLVAVAAGALPAFRAAMLDPMAALREE